MRTPTFIAALFLATLTVSVAGIARAEHHLGQPPSTFTPPPTSEPQEHHRRGEVNEFGAATKPKERPFPWRAVVLGVLLFGVASPFALMAYRSTSKDLSDMKTVGRVGVDGEKARPSSKERAAAAEEPALGDGTPRDRVWDAIQSVDQWVPVDWVARTANLSVDEAAEELNLLAEEGQIEHTSDRSGNPIFRAVS